MSGYCDHTFHIVSFLINPSFRLQNKTQPPQQSLWTPTVTPTLPISDSVDTDILLPHINLTFDILTRPLHDPTSEDAISVVEVPLSPPDMTTDFTPLSPLNTPPADNLIIYSC